MSSRLRRIAVWIRRIAYCRGFGIQSPSAYAFVRYVINEHYPYYAYSTLAQAYPHADRRQRRLLRLYLRLANHLQPQWAVEQTDDLSATRLAYLHAGCAHTHATHHVPTSATPQRPRMLVRVTADDEGLRMALQGIAAASPDSIIVVEGIRRSHHATQLWHQLQQHPHAGVSYDLYYCGILMLDPTKYKRSYTINF